VAAVAAPTATLPWPAAPPAVATSNIVMQALPTRRSQRKPQQPQQLRHRAAPRPQQSKGPQPFATGEAVGGKRVAAAAPASSHTLPKRRSADTPSATQPLQCSSGTANQPGAALADLTDLVHA
jgi:hypothetical protein